MARSVRTAVCLALLLVGGCSDDDGDEATTSTAVRSDGEAVARGDEASFLVRLSPQTGDGTQVVVDEVVLTGSPGFVAVYDDGDGAPGRLLGVSAALEAGTSSDVAVPLDDPLGDTAVVHAMVHLDDDANGRFEPPAHDPPATVEGAIVEVAAEVTVED